MKIVVTLYKKCRFTKSYSEGLNKSMPIIGNMSYLDAYLYSLDKKEIEIDNTYYENNMEIVIERTNLQNPYDYNYAKIEEYDDNLNLILKRYCFINKIECKNGLAYVDFEEDIWHSYCDKIYGSAPCVLIRSRAKNYRNLFGYFETLELPVEPDGNNALDIKTIPEIYTGYVTVIMEIQAFKLTQQGEVGNRFSFYYALARRYSGQTQINPKYSIPQDAFKTTMENAYESITYLLANMAEGKLHFVSGQWSFEIGNVYIVPYSFFIDSFAKTDEMAYDYEQGVFGAGYAYNDFIPDYKDYVGKVLCRLNPNDYNLLLNSFSSYILNDYKTFSIGTFSNQIRIVNNDTDKRLDIKFAFAQNYFSIKLSIGNQMYDITNDFKFEIPYESLTADVVQQRKIALALQNNDLKYGIDVQDSKIFKSTYALAKNVGEIIAGFVGGGDISAAQNLIPNAIDLSINIAGKYKLQEDKTLINSPQYSANKGLFNNVNYFLNFTYGIIICNISPDNGIYVIDSCNNFGLKVFKFIDNAYNLRNIINGTYIHDTDEYNYNVIRFDGISVYGDFSQEIANKLNDILSKGIKIWYDSSFQEDGKMNDILDNPI